MARGHTTRSRISTYGSTSPFLTPKKIEDDDELSPRHKKMLEKAEELERKVFPNFDSATENQLILFRLGYARSIEVGTLRKPLESFIDSSD